MIMTIVAIFIRREEEEEEARQQAQIQEEMRRIALEEERRHMQQVSTVVHGMYGQIPHPRIHHSAFKVCDSVSTVCK